MPLPKSPFIQRIIRWRLLIVVNLLVVIFLGMSLGREYVRSHSISAEITSLQQEAELLAARNIEISELRTAMQTESFIEREARLKLGLKKPGETVVVIQDETVMMNEGERSADPNDPLGYVLDTADVGISVANPSKWWYYFFDKQHYKAISDYE